MRTVIITGASDGIGAAAARALGGPDHRLILVGRSPAKTAMVAEEVGAAHAFASDFADLAQVRTLAEQLRSVCPRIDVLANNAGGLFSGPQRTVDGYERTFQVNHLAPFLLTNLLMEPLLRSGASVVNTSSIGARLFGSIDVDDLDSWEGFRPNQAYGTSKLANILFAKELHVRYAARGLSAVAFHPGNVATSFASDTTSYFRWVYHTGLHLFLVSPEKGGRTLAHFINGRAERDWSSGEFYGSDRRISRTHRQAYDPTLASDLWDRSAAMVGIAASSHE